MDEGAARGTGEGFRLTGGFAVGQANTNTSVTVNGAGTGRTFDGVGAISGGGGNTVQLPAYPAQQRSDILDLFFKPGAGAALQILKVEIGGDANSSAGAEPSHEHSKGSITTGGYEWWLIQEAKARNPKIKLYALAWSAPGWVSENRGNTVWTQSFIGYLVDYLTLAKSKGITFDYLGAWNEHPYKVNVISYDAGWIQSLRTALNNAGFGSVKLVQTDMPPWADTTGGTYNTSIGWEIAGADATTLADVGVIGCHDVSNWPTDGKQVYSTAAAQACGKPLWQSEIGDMPGTDGSPFIRAILRGYIDAKITGTIQWPIITTQPYGIPYSDRGMIWAAQPRTGYYIVKAMIAAYAMVTQFTGVGWKFIDSGCGYLGGNRNNGSYVSLQAADHSAWSLIVETTTASSSDELTVRVTGGLPASKVHVWWSNPTASSPTGWMTQGADITPDASGSFSMWIRPGYIYAFTTTTGQGMLRPSIPANSTTWALPYSDSFTETSAAAGTMPAMFAPQDGSFEYKPAGDRSGEYVVTQTTPACPVMWVRGSTSRFPYAVIGGGGFPENYLVQAQVLFQTRQGSADLIARFGNGTQGQYINNFRGYIFDLGSGGDWWLTKNTINVGNIVMQSGRIVQPALGTWITIGLSVRGGWVGAFVGNTWVASHTDGDSLYQWGTAGIGTDAFRQTWSPVQFKNFSISPA